MRINAPRDNATAFTISGDADNVKDAETELLNLAEEFVRHAASCVCVCVCVCVYSARVFSQRLATRESYSPYASEPRNWVI